MREYWGTKKWNRAERRYHESTTREVFYELLKKDFNESYFNETEEWIKNRIERISVVASIATEKVDKTTYEDNL